MARAKKTRNRPPLTRERALRAAVELADREGLAELSMRRLAAVLGVEAMSLYHHVPNKEAILSGMVDLVFAEIDLPPRDGPWQSALRRRMSSMREVLVRHRWALRILESPRAPGAITLAHHDAVLGCLRDAGFSIDLAAHAFAVLDSYVFGFVHTELTLPMQSPQETQEVANSILAGIPEGMFPHLVELARTRVLVPGYAYANEFPFGLELILDGLERARVAEASRA
ncbi:MAG: TetR/AcrR family transcriptional regulator C-terminal domain-containing protein [Nannocystaceae bacterium]